MKCITAESHGPEYYFEYSIVILSDFYINKVSAQSVSSIQNLTFDYNLVGDQRVKKSFNLISKMISIILRERYMFQIMRIIGFKYSIQREIS